jgi:hypothetical protein
VIDGLILVERIAFSRCCVFVVFASHTERLSRPGGNFNFNVEFFLFFLLRGRRRNVYLFLLLRDDGKGA